MGTKGQNIPFEITWEIVRKSKAYKPGNSHCRLCIDEKLSILDNWGDIKLINKDKMTMHPCTHKNTYKISNYKIKLDA